MVLVMIIIMNKHEKNNISFCCLGHMEEHIDKKVLRKSPSEGNGKDAENGAVMVNG